MSDDLLRKAAAALREETSDADEGARFTRARVMASLQQSEHRRRTRLALLLPIAACFAAATAWGTVNGRAGAWVSRVSEALGLQSSAAPKEAGKPTNRRGSPRLTPGPKPVPSVLAPEASAEPTEMAAPTAEPPAATPTPELAPPPKAAPALSSRASRSLAADRAGAKPEPAPKVTENTAPAHEDISDRAHELYRVAHRSHFVEHDYVSALRAWDAYLSEAPGGRFVLEARYNRALCLVRLGRTDEARSALAPFASGSFAGYRQQEASALLDALVK
jgi:TolA-binding protein